MNPKIAIAAALAATACTPTLDVPDTLAPSSNETLALSMPARGVQIYACRERPGEPAAYEWTFVAPDAELLDPRGRVAALHGAGPYWQAVDGSRITAKVRARAEAPDARAIPWLLLEAKSTGPAGTFSEVTSVQRVNTYGASAPATGCGRDTVGREAHVRYIAEYRFFTRRLER